VSPEIFALHRHKPCADFMDTVYYILIDMVMQNWYILQAMKHGYGHGHGTRHGHSDTANNLKKSHNSV